MTRYHGVDSDGPSAGTVLFLAHHYPPSSASAATRPSHFARYLPRFGYEPVVVAAGSPAPGEAVPRTRYLDENAMRGLTARAAIGLARLVQRLLPYQERLAWATAAAVVGAELCSSRRIDLLLSTSNPLGTHLAAMYLARRFRLPWIADFQDPLCDNSARDRRWLFSYDAPLERAIFARASALIANTDTTADLWRARYPQFASKISHIFNGFDPQEPCAALPIPARQRRVLAHVGSLYGERHPGLLLASIDRLIRRGALDPASLKIELVGPTHQACLDQSRSALEFLCARGCLECGSGEVPREVALRVMAEADWLLLLDLHGTAGLHVPAKLFEYVRIGRPILAWTRKGSPVERILGQSGIPHRCISPSLAPEETDRLVMELLSLPSAPTPASAWFTQTFDAAAQTGRLAHLLDRVSPVAAPVL